MPKWDITWRDGFIEGFSTADTTEDILASIQYIMEAESPIKIEVKKR